VFIANILTIDRLSESSSQDVKTISDADDDINLNAEEKRLLDLANGRVLLFYLSGPMIFGVAKAISREHAAMPEANALVIDLSDVPMMGVTAALAIENAVQDAYDKGLYLFIVGATSKVRRRLEKFGIDKLVPPQHFLDDRLNALGQAVSLTEPEFANGRDRDNINHPTDEQSTSRAS
jgi:SulP family sulfate permease